MDRSKSASPPESWASNPPRLSLSAEDVSFLLEVIPRLPAETDQQGRITLDLNGQIAMLAKGDGPSPVTQVVLRNSHRSGDEMRLNTDRQFLVRAAQLGFHEIELHGSESPVVCRDERRIYRCLNCRIVAVRGNGGIDRCEHPVRLTNPNPVRSKGSLCH